ncbi:holin [Streptomyces sp. CAU 1734]|uniref:holin n=1 Tax=Streptomyces sp. CAU 1734 TaxID=3140360 RepID=UPI0032603625
MPSRAAWRVCSVPGCPEFTQRGRCDDHRREAEQRRGSARQRGYGTRHERDFRKGVLARDPRCVCMDTAHDHPAPCGQSSRHADHHPLDRRELTAQGLDPDDPRHGRGLCPSCHSKHTAQAQPGGWNA